MTTWIAGGIGFSLLGVFLCWVAARSVREDVNYQKMPGLRTPQTLQSREAWLAAHRRIFPTLWRTGLAGLCLGVGGVVWGALDGRGSADSTGIICLLVSVPVFVYVYVVGTQAGSHAETGAAQRRGVQRRSRDR